MDGALLVMIDDTFLRETLGILNSLMRKKVLRQIQLLKDSRDAVLKVGRIDYNNTLHSIDTSM